MTCLLAQPYDPDLHLCFPLNPCLSPCYGRQLYTLSSALRRGDLPLLLLCSLPQQSWSIIHIAMWINSTQCVPGDPFPLSLSLETSLYLCPFLTSPPSPVKSSLQTTSKPHQRICIPNSPQESALTFPLHTPRLAWPTVSFC